MNENTEDLHVSPAGDSWCVEKSSGASVAHETSKERAVNLAQKIGPEEGATEVVVHAADGTVEKKLPAEIPPGESAEG